MRYSLSGGLLRKTQTKVLNVGVAFVFAATGLGSSLPVLLSQTVNALSGASNVYMAEGGTGDCSKASPCGDFATALAAVADNGTIHLAAGTYTEAIDITQSVKIVGAGEGVTTISAPATLPGSGSIVTIDGSSTSATLSNVTVSGPFDATSCSPSEYDVKIVGGATASLKNIAVTNAEDSNSTLWGCQHGIAILVGHAAESTTGHATINNVTVSGYQKGGIVVDNSGSTATIENSTVTGAGAVSYTAQNGVQVSRGATATIKGNTITGNSYTLTASNSATAAGVLLYGAGDHTVVENNTITGNQIGYFTEDEANLKYLNLTGITGNTRNAVAWTKADYSSAWTTPTTTYADASLTGTSDDVYGSDIVATEGSLHVWGYDAFNTVQGALNAVATNGTVNVAGGTYSEDLNFPDKDGVKLVGQSEANVHINTNNTDGYGVQIRNLHRIKVSNVTFSSSTSDQHVRYGLQAHEVNGLTFTDVTFNGPGKNFSGSQGKVGGLDVNSSQSVTYNNVSVNNYSKNGFSLTAQYQSTDAYSHTIKFEGVTAANNGWAGIAFYTMNDDNTLGHNFTTVSFSGNNSLTGNGQGLFVEGDSDANFDALNIPRYGITGSGGAPVDLGTTAFSGNTQDIVNYQENGLEALSATFNGLTGNEMTADQHNTENGSIIDQRDDSKLGLVNYYTSTVALPAPTNLLPASGAYTNNNQFDDSWSAVSGAVKYEYHWSASSNVDANGALTGTIGWDDNSVSSPSNYDFSSAPGTVIRHNGPTTDGVYYWQVRAFDSEGNPGAWSTVNKVTVDTIAPVATITAPNNGDTLSYATNGTVDIRGSVTDTNPDHYYLVITGPNGYSTGPGTVYDSSSFTDQSLYSWNLTGLKTGTYTIDLEARDAAGNKDGGSVATIKVTVDNTPAIPTAALADANGKTISPNGYINTKNFTFNLSDSSSTITHYQLKYWNNISSSPYDGESNAWNPTNLSGYSTNPAQLGAYVDSFTQGEGAHYFAFSACDAAGNCSAYSSPFTVSYDATAPAGPTASPAAGSYTSAQLVTLTSSDSGSGLASIYYTTDGSTPSSTNGTLYTGAFSVSNSETVQAISYDNAGNASSVAPFTYTITSAPLAIFHSAAAVLGASTINLQNGGNGQVLGASTINSTTTPQVLGDSTVNFPASLSSSNSKSTGSKNASNFLTTLHWWYLLILAALALFLFFLLFSRRRNSGENSQN